VLPAARQNIRLLRASGDAGAAVLAKYARAGYLLSAADPSDHSKADRTARGLDLLEATLSRLVERAALPRLGTYGLREEHIDALAAAAAAKTNPVPIGKAEYAELLRTAL